MPEPKLQFSALKHSLREDKEGEITLVLKIPATKQDRISAYALPIETVLNLTANWEDSNG